MNSPMIEAKDLSKHFELRRALSWGSSAKVVHAVDHVSFSVNEGQTFGLVGESGCGKTTLSKLLLALYKPKGGSLRVAGHEISTMSRREEGAFRSQVQAVFQDPYGAINPRQQVWKFVTEALRQQRNLGSQESLEKSAELLSLVGLSPDSGTLYPHSFSGGMRQRLAIARAISVQPKVLILDEPVSALDVSIRAQILNLLKDLQKRFKLTYVFIGHDLAVVRYMADQIGVMYLGKLVEIGESAEVFNRPRHPYTQALLATARSTAVSDSLYASSLLKGEVASPINLPVGCRFGSRCTHATELCAQQAPLDSWVSNTHFVACHRHTELQET